MRERAHREASSVLLVPLGYVVSDGGQACPLCHLGPPNPEGSLRLTGCLSVPTGHWVPWLIAPLCLKTPPPSQPSHLRDGGGKWPPDSRYPRAEWHQLNLQRLGEVPGLEARCQGLGHRSVSVHAPPPLTPPPPGRAYLLTSSALMDLRSDPDLALSGHQRKTQFPGGSAGKPGTIWLNTSSFVPRASGLCGSRYGFSFPLPHPGSRPLASCLPLATHRNFPALILWQPSDRPAKSWTIQSQACGNMAHRI